LSEKWQDFMTDTMNHKQIQATGETVWLQNLEAMYHADSRLAQQIDDLPEDDRLISETAKNGQATLKVRLPEGREIYLHSKYDPAGEAERFVDGLDLEKNFVFFFSGIGLGYQVRRLFDQSSDQTIVVVFEPELSVIRSAFRAILFAEEIREKRLIFLPLADKGLMHARLTPFTSLMIMGMSFEVLNYTKEWHSEFHVDMRKYLTDYMYFSRMSYVTMIGNSKVTQENVADNLVDYVCCPTIDSLRNRFKGYPAIVVSAGPSLAKNVSLLKEAKGHAVIVAVQTVFKMLRGMGIDPDFVTSLDYSNASRRFFEGVDDFGTTQLVADPKANCVVLDLYKGRKRLINNEFADLCLGPAAQKRESLRSGSTVAHLCFYLSEYLGANPIILIGQDLGFTNNMYYAPGNAVHTLWSVELNRFDTLEMKEWERIVRNRNILRKIKDINGREIFTDEQMFTYLQQFERDFAQTSAKVIDATEGGARKQNTEIMTLAQALQKYAEKPIPAELFDRGEDIRWFDPSPLPELIRQLENRQEEIEAFKKICEKTRDLLEQLQKLIDKPDEFNRLIVQVDEIRSLVRMHAKIQQMVCGISAKAELRRFMHDRHLGAEKTQGTQRARNQMKRDVEYMDALIVGCDDLRSLLERAKDRALKAKEEYDERK
jgi:hypothetical protein